MSTVKKIGTMALKGGELSELDKDRLALLNLGVSPKTIAAYRESMREAVTVEVNAVLDRDHTNKRFGLLKALFEVEGLPIRVGEFNKARLEIIAGNRTVIKQFLALSQDAPQQFCEDFALLMKNPTAYSRFNQTKAGQWLSVLLIQKDKTEPMTPERAAQLMADFKNQFPDRASLESVLANAVRTPALEQPKAPARRPENACDLKRSLTETYLNNVGLAISLLEYDSEIKDALLEIITAHCRNLQIPPNTDPEKVPDLSIQHRQDFAPQLLAFVMKSEPLTIADIPKIQEALKIKAP